MSERVAIRLPDLDLPEAKPRVSLWLVPTGARVTRGDRILEIIADPITFDVSAPEDGRIVEKCVPEETDFEPGDCLGYLLVDGF
mgnify:CR=1 FL=1